MRKTISQLFVCFTSVKLFLVRMIQCYCSHATCWFAAHLLVLFVPAFNIHHQVLSGGGREASGDVSVLPGHWDGDPEVPQRPGV